MFKPLRRLNYLLRQRHIEAELAAEIETHRSMKEADLRRAGLQSAEARWESRRALGNSALAREDARHVWVPPSLESVWQDASYAVRMIRRSPGFAVSMIVVMALGIGATVGVFSLVDGLVLKPLPVRQPERLVYLSNPSFSYPVFSELSTRATHLFESLVAWNMEREYVEWNTELEPTEVLMASGAFYSTLGVHASVGRVFTEADDVVGGGRDGLVAVISYAAWQQRFNGDASVVGRTVRIRRQPFTIVGVAPQGFFGVAPGLAPELTIPLTVLERERLPSRTSSWLHLLGRLRTGLSVREADAALQTIWRSVLEVTTTPDMPAQRRAMYLSRTTTLESARAGYSRVRNQFEEPLWMLLALVTLLLTVAAASGANLLLARGAARGREFAVRIAIGAGRMRLLRQVITEAFVWTLLGAVAGLLVAAWSSGQLVSMMTTWDEPIVLNVLPDRRIVLTAIALAFLTAVACAILPAFRTTRVAAGSTLKEFGQIRGSLSAGWSGKSLVTLQVGLTVVLLFGAALFGRSLQSILSQDAGLNPAGLFVIGLEAGEAGYEGARFTTFYDSVLERLRNTPGVQSASLSKYPPISNDDGAWTQSIGIDGAPVEMDASRSVHFNAVTPRYFQTVGMHLLQGRDFSEQDGVGAERVVIVSESLARVFFPGQNPLGRRISIGRSESRRDLVIVGVVGNSKYQRLTEPSRSIAFLPSAQVQDLIEGDELFVEVRAASDDGSIAETLRRQIRSLDQRVPLRIETVADRIRVSLVKERVITTIAAFLGFAALILACAGVYGLLAYIVSRQTSEIGLRLALGASRRQMLWMVIRQSLLLGGAGILLGVTASLGLGRFARNLLYQVSETDVLALAVAAVIMFVVAMAAGFFPARRAANVDPLIALRTE